MKSLKNMLAAAAFVFAVSAVFAFDAAQAWRDANGLAAGGGQQVTVPQGCDIVVDQFICTFQMLNPAFPADPLYATQTDAELNKNQVPIQNFANLLYRSTP